MRRPATGVRVRVTALATVLVAFVLASAALVLVSMQRVRLVDNLDNTLRLRSDDVAAAVGLGDFALGGGPSRDGEVGLLQVVDAQGTVVAASANVVGDPPVAPFPHSASDVTRTIEDLPLDDDRFRIASRVVDSPLGPVAVHAGASLDPIDESITLLRTGLSIVVPAVVIALGAVVWVLVGRTLSPIEAIRRTVASMDGSDLAERVPVPGGADEVGRLATTMNDLLDRIEDASARQQRFVADASHELRSPLTRMRSELEVDLAHPDGVEIESAQRSLLEETIALQELVEDLLHLARSDAGIHGAVIEAVDLDDLVLVEARRIRGRSEKVVDTALVSAGQVRGDRSQLRSVVRNLAENAVRYATTTVSFGVFENAGMVQLTVTDDGPGIGPPDRERVFERFARGDSARTRADGGSGLGLAIVRDIVEAHGGTVVVDPGFVDGARLVVRLPAFGTAVAGAPPGT